MHKIIFGHKKAASISEAAGLKNSTVLQ